MALGSVLPVRSTQALVVDVVHIPNAQWHLQRAEQDNRIAS